jgi:hypothetical protein
MTELRSFHNDLAVKAKYVGRVRAHIAADHLIRGTGWNGARGCAVGCTLEAYDHARYPVELGLPEWLARLEDTLFEGMSQEKSRTWPERFLAAIPLGVTEDQFERRVRAPFLIFVLEHALTTFDHEKFPDVKLAVDRSIALWRRDDIGSSDWIEQAQATWEAALAAARAEAAWEAALAAARAAAARAAAAAWEAAAAARAEAYDRFADELLRLLEGSDHD